MDTSAGLSIPVPGGCGLSQQLQFWQPAVVGSYGFPQLWLEWAGVGQEPAQPQGTGKHCVSERRERCVGRYFKPLSYIVTNAHALYTGKSTWLL